MHNHQVAQFCQIELRTWAIVVDGLTMRAPPLAYLELMQIYRSFH